MEYYIIEGTPEGKYNASSKARNDVETILRSQKIKPFYIETKKGVQKNKLMKWKQILQYLKNSRIWYNGLKKLNKDDTVYIQYPLLNTTLAFNKIIRKFKKRGIRFISIIHDMDSLRYKPENQGRFLCARVKHEDTKILLEMNKIIAHNESMKKELIKYGNESEKIISLGIFDYLVNKEPKELKRSKKDPIVIAGNLSSEKANYLSKLKELNIKFNLFGVGYNEKNGGKNIYYKGKFLPEELLDYLEGSFGLVWDGQSTEKCEGGFGEYLKYNNPHKASLYLTAGMPIIVWSHSALANFVLDNKIGIIINNLGELDKKVNNLSDKEYSDMKKNAEKIGKRLKEGYYLKKALKATME